MCEKRGHVYWEHILRAFHFDSKLRTGPCVTHSQFFVAGGAGQSGSSDGDGVDGSIGRRDGGGANRPGRRSGVGNSGDGEDKGKGKEVIPPPPAREDAVHEGIRVTFLSNSSINFHPENDTAATDLLEPDGGTDQLHFYHGTDATGEIWSFLSGGVHRTKHNSFYSKDLACYWTTSKAFAVWWAAGKAVVRTSPQVLKLKKQHHNHLSFHPPSLTWTSKKTTVSFIVSFTKYTLKTLINMWGCCRCGEPSQDLEEPYCENCEHRMCYECRVEDYGSDE
jgi:hypothetical protein